MSWGAGTRRPKQPWHRGTYHVRSRRLTAAARANPYTRCARCGRTLAEHGTTARGEPPTWSAGHQDDHLLEQYRHDQATLDRWPLLAEVLSCNRAAGARKGNRARRGSVEAVTALRM